LTPAQICVKL